MYRKYSKITKMPIALTNAQQHYHRHQWKGVLQMIAMGNLGNKRREMYRQPSILRSPHQVGILPADTFPHFRAGNPYYSQVIQDQLTVGASEMKSRTVRFQSTTFGVKLKE